MARERQWSVHAGTVQNVPCGKYRIKQNSEYPPLDGWLVIYRSCLNLFCGALSYKLSLIFLEEKRWSFA